MNSINHQKINIMKAKKTILLCVILLAGCMTEGLKAQESLNALMKKCEEPGYDRYERDL